MKKEDLPENYKCNVAADACMLLICRLLAERKIKSQGSKTQLGNIAMKNHQEYIVQEVHLNLHWLVI